MLGMPGLSTIRSSFSDRRGGMHGNRACSVAGRTVASTRFGGGSSRMANAMAIGWAHHGMRAIFPATSLAIGSNLDSSIDVSFSNTGLLPLSNSESLGNEVVFLFQSVGVAPVEAMISGTAEGGLQWPLTMPTVAATGFRPD